MGEIEPETMDCVVQAPPEEEEEEEEEEELVVVVEEDTVRLPAELVETQKLPSPGRLDRWQLSG